tara:strand:- start:656 stop:1114 length:459 start_codon:yes stop_codon:yes gene_type:complete
MNKEEMERIILSMKQTIENMKQQNEQDRMRWRLEKIELMQRISEKKKIDVFAHLDTIKEKIRYILDFYKEQHPDSYKHSMLMTILIWTEIDGIPRLLLDKYKSKELTNADTVSRTLRLMKRSGEIFDAEHNKERLQKEIVHRKAFADLKDEG